MLKGANGDELKKVKHVVQYGVFAAYHLALETSFLADEGATLPELPLKSPIMVALPDKPSSIERSISTIPGFTVPCTGTPSGSQSTGEVQKSNNSTGELQKYGNAGVSVMTLSTNVDHVCRLEGANLSKGPSSQTAYTKHALSSFEPTGFFSLSPSGQDISGPCHNMLSSNNLSRKGDKVDHMVSFQHEKANSERGRLDGKSFSTCFGASVASEQGVSNSHVLTANRYATSELSSLNQDNNDHNEEIRSSKEKFPPSPSDHQSILVSLSTRCVWKGTVCELAHLFRIKYYGSFDKPLGRFLRDHLFDQVPNIFFIDMIYFKYIPLSILQL